MKTNVFAFQDRKAIEAQAREWLIRLDGDTPLTSNESEALRAWVARSPAHRAELVRIARFWHEADLLSQLAIPLRKHGRGVGGWLSRAFSAEKRPWAIAACVALLGIAVIVAPLALYQPPTASNGVYTTRIGERQVQTLADGSVVELNTASTIQVDYTEDVRVIRLLQGEAYFRVVHDATRPFEVFAGGGMVRAVGTAFSVRVEQDDVAVTVAEGRVELATVTEEHPLAPVTTDGGGRSVNARSHAFAAKPAVAVLGQLSSGHSATFADVIHEVRVLRADDLLQQLAWRDGMLVFAGEPLSDVIAEVARYTPIQIEIADPALRTIPVGGRFKAGDVDAMLDVLAVSFGIEVVRVNALHVRLIARQAHPGDPASSEKPARDI